MLSTAEVDKYDNMNSTKTAPDSHLIGSGGANDAVNAKEVLLIAPQSRQRLVENVYYVSCPGNRVNALVTDMGIFQKMDGEFSLTCYFPDSTVSSSTEAIDRIRQNCGWELRTAAHVTEIPIPSEDELLLLRTFDPQGYFTKAR